MTQRKGIILAGGNGTRLYPLTQVLSKQLLPVYNKPMIYYPLTVLMLAKIRDILIISTPHDLDRFKALLGDGSQWGLQFTYAAQASPRGLADAFLVGEKFIGQDHCALVLGDNIFYGDNFSATLQDIARAQSGADIFACRVKNPQEYGVIEFDKKGMACSIEEKPQTPRSSFAVPGLYFYDDHVIEMAKSLKPSSRGELEITDINRLYMEQGLLRVHELKRGTAWFDSGTHFSLLQTSTFIETIEMRQDLLIGSPEEVAYRLNYIDAEQLNQLAQKLLKTGYGEYLLRLIS